MAKIIFLGYMGSGKTTVGLALSNKINLPFYDLDEIITTKTGLTISEIFIQKGEIWFRKKEHELLKELIVSDKDFILSLGGGTPCYANNHLLLQKKGVQSVYLKANVKTLVDRLSQEKENRPMIKNISGDLASFVGPHLLERMHFYNYASFKVSVDFKTRDEIINELMSVLF